MNSDSWNIRTLQDSDALTERKTVLVSLVLKTYSIDIAVLMETPLAGSSQFGNWKAVMLFFWFGMSANEVHHSGVNIAIRSHLERKLSFFSKKGRIITLTLDYNINTMNSTVQEKYDFSNNLCNVITHVQNRDKSIVTGVNEWVTISSSGMVCLFLMVLDA